MKHLHSCHHEGASELVENLLAEAKAEAEKASAASFVIGVAVV